MKQQVLFIHGGDSFGTRAGFLEHLRTVPLREVLEDRPKRFVGTLRAELGENFEVYLPSMPNSQNADYEEWSIWFERYLELLHDNVILIGWSLGGLFLAKYLTEHKAEVRNKALFLLAAPAPDYVGAGDNNCERFRFASGALRALREQVDHIEIWHSADDFVVPVGNAAVYQKHLPRATTRLFVDKNHFLLPELPELVEAVRNLA